MERRGGGKSMGEGGSVGGGMKGGKEGEMG